MKLCPTTQPMSEEAQNTSPALQSNTVGIDHFKETQAPAESLITPFGSPVVPILFFLFFLFLFIIFFFYFFIIIFLLFFFI